MWEVTIAINGESSNLDESNNSFTVDDADSVSITIVPNVMVGQSWSGNVVITKVTSGTEFEPEV